jgi:prevent-host-death family protein
MCHNVHMRAISIRELHLATGRWVRRAGARDAVVITDRGRPVATLVPYQGSHSRRGLPDREKEIRKLPRLPVDSGDIVSEMRERG